MSASAAGIAVISLADADKTVIGSSDARVPWEECQECQGPKDGTESDGDEDEDDEARTGS